MLSFKEVTHTDQAMLETWQRVLKNVLDYDLPGFAVPTVHMAYLWAKHPRVGTRTEHFLAFDGDEAVGVARAFVPDIVLLDIAMPKLNGYEAARRILEERGEKRPVLIALTGWGHDENRMRTKEAGFDHHLVKPVELDALSRLLATVEV